MPFVEETCTKCDGKGWVWPDPNTRCVWCGGTGKIREWKNIAEETQQGGGQTGCLVLFFAALFLFLFTACL